MTKRCPACGSVDWYADYDRTGDGDEIRVDRCERCDWPPPYPVTVDEWCILRGIAAPR